MTNSSIKEERKECPVCKWGLGLWAIGYPSPMGPSDGASGYPTIKCPKCGGDKNPIDKYGK
jgi:hypothetical protein